MRLRAALAPLLLALLAVPAGATVVLRAGVEDLAERCGRAVLGRVVDTATVEDRADGTFWTQHRVRPEETWIGEGGGDVIVSVPGGTIGRVTQEFHGGAHLVRDGRVALFLWTDARGRHQVLGEAQGAFAVTRDRSTGEDSCTNSVEGLALVDAAGKTVDARPTSLSLQDLRRRVADVRRAREDRERAAREARARRLADRRARAVRLAALLRGRPGAPAE
jgi:hypothetical protein